MSTASAAVAAGRAAALALMVDTCTIRHRTGAGTQDETRGRVTPSLAVVYSGRCRVQSAQAQPRQVEVVDRTATLQEVTVSIPVGSGAVRVGAEVTVDVAALDAELAGRRFTVTGIHHKTHATAQRLQCVEVTA